MSETEKVSREGPSQYPIQAKFIAVRELFIEANVVADSKITVDAEEFLLKTSHSSYDAERHIIQVGAQVEFGIERKPDTNYPFSLRVHIMGQFEVDEATFAKDKIPLWARINAPYILYPFLREQVFALTARCGFNPVILPLVYLPTVKIDRPAIAKDSDSSESAP